MFQKHDEVFWDQLHSFIWYCSIIYVLQNDAYTMEVMIKNNNLIRKQYFYGFVIRSEPFIHSNLWTKYIYVLHDSFKYISWICFGCEGIKIPRNLSFYKKCAVDISVWRVWEDLFLKVHTFLLQLPIKSHCILFPDRNFNLNSCIYFIFLCDEFWE